jgi:hypothetical protein
MGHDPHHLQTEALVQKVPAGGSHNSEILGQKPDASAAVRELTQRRHPGLSRVMTARGAASDGGAASRWRQPQPQQEPHLRPGPAASALTRRALHHRTQQVAAPLPGWVIRVLCISCIVFQGRMPVVRKAAPSAQERRSATCVNVRPEAWCRHGQSCTGLDPPPTHNHPHPRAALPTSQRAGQHRNQRTAGTDVPLATMRAVPAAAHKYLLRLRLRRRRRRPRVLGDQLCELLPHAAAAPQLVDARLREHLPTSEAHFPNEDDVVGGALKIVLQ